MLGWVDFVWSTCLQSGDVGSLRMCRNEGACYRMAQEGLTPLPLQPPAGSGALIMLSEAQALNPQPEADDTRLPRKRLIVTHPRVLGEAPATKRMACSIPPNSLTLRSVCI